VVKIHANATQPGGAITEVRFFANESPVGTATTPPYEVTLAGLTAGNYSIKAVALGAGLSTTSSVVNVVVTSSSNAAPSVAMVTPANNSVQDECGEILLTAAANDGDGSVTNIAYYLNDTTLLDTRPTSPYLLAATLPLGTNNLTAVATDNLGARATSSVVRAIFTPVPANALSANLLSAGPLKLCFRGLAGSNYVFEYSTNLGNASGWVPFATNLAPAGQSGLISVSGPMQALAPEKYFRVRRQ
jgi:hypothetical protein